MVTQLISTFEYLMQSPIRNVLVKYEASALRSVARNVRKTPKAGTKLFKQARRI